MCGAFGLQGTLCVGKYRCYYVLPPSYSTGHMAMNANRPGNQATSQAVMSFYL